MAKIPRNLKVEQIDFVANSLRTRRLALSTFKDLLLEFYTSASLSGDIITVDQYLKMIQKISVILNGQDTLVSVPFYFLYYMNYYEFSSIPPTLITTSATDTKINKVVVLLPFALLRAVNPQDTLLDARRLTSCILEVQFGAVITGMTNVTGHLQIDTAEYASVAADQGFSRHEYGWEEIALDKVGIIETDLEVRSNNQYRRLWLFAWDGSTPAVRSDAEITNIEVKSRSFYYYDQEASSTQFRNALEFNLMNPAQLVIGGNQVAYAHAAGVYVIDLPTFGLMSQRADARALSEFVVRITSGVTDATLDIIKEKAIYA